MASLWGFIGSACVNEIACYSVARGVDVDDGKPNQETYCRPVYFYVGHCFYPVLVDPCYWADHKIQSPGPIFFRQPRSGRNNQSFACLKFRSMVVNTDANEKQAVRRDKRITPIGKFLRKTN
ncbi:MAG TPA: hypothetical protein DCG88_22775 [Sphingobacterium sp.]|nr:hypothetical protein [Sphingobacterium sp.]